MASAVALDFYRATLEAGESPAEALRASRATVTDDGPKGSGTRLAYQFFGHPNMRMATPEPVEGGTP